MRRVAVLAAGAGALLAAGGGWLALSTPVQPGIESSSLSYRSATCSIREVIFTAVPMTIFSLEAVPMFGEDTRTSAGQGACCIPLAASEGQAQADACCLPLPAAAATDKACCP